MIPFLWPFAKIDVPCSRNHCVHGLGHCGVQIKESGVFVAARGAGYADVLNF